MRYDSALRGCWGYWSPWRWPVFLAINYCTVPLRRSAVARRSYWLLLTLVLVMNPCSTLTRERNKRRLIGTLIGCAIAFLLFKIDPSNTVYFLIMWLLYTLALCFLPTNYLYGATFVTIFIMIAFYFLHESGRSEERRVGM